MVFIDLDPEKERERQSGVVEVPDHTGWRRWSSSGVMIRCQHRRGAEEAADLVAELPAAGSAPSIGLGLGVECSNWGEPRDQSLWPHILFIALCDGGPSTFISWTPPTRA
jgi:hypothetical protein